MPKEKVDEMVETFRSLKQRVLWRFDGKPPGMTMNRYFEHVAGPKILLQFKQISRKM